MIRATIAIPTHNRAHTLGQTLRSVFQLQIPPATSLACIVIDNGSTDSTAEVFEHEASSAPFPARRVFEPTLGESRARNRAIDEADADFILFIDDDAAAEPRWACELLAAFSRRPLDAVCGMVLPSWAAERPDWLGPRIYSKLAVHDRAAIEASGAEEVERVGNFFGANMALRCAALGKFGRFREDLGVTGTSAISGADTDFFERIRERGGSIGFAPRAIVYHLVEQRRMTRPYLLRKSFEYGVGSALAGRTSHNRPDKLIRNSIRMLGAELRRDPEGAMYHRMECANFFGYWYGRIIAQRRTSQ